MKKYLSLGCLALLLGSCEKDDICDPNTLTTPRLVVEFFDYNASDQLKPVTDLQITSSASNDTLNYTGVSKIYLPLHTGQDQVRYQFKLNANSTNPGFVFTDQLAINYQRELQYVSRGCGYKSVFSFANTGAVQIVADDDTDWLRSATVVQYAINNENETHLRLYF